MIKGYTPGLRPFRHSATYYFGESGDDGKFREKKYNAIVMSVTWITLRPSGEPCQSSVHNTNSAAHIQSELPTISGGRRICNRRKQGSIAWK